MGLLSSAWAKGSDFISNIYFFYINDRLQTYNDLSPFLTKLAMGNLMGTHSPAIRFGKKETKKREALK
jgi:hypothetical protein